jgi:hypothetical protein
LFEEEEDKGELKLILLFELIKFTTAFLLLKREIWEIGKLIKLIEEYKLE